MKWKTLNRSQWYMNIVKDNSRQKYDPYANDRGISRFIQKKKKKNSTEQYTKIKYIKDIVFYCLSRFAVYSKFKI